MRSLVVMQEGGNPDEAEGRTNLESPEKHEPRTSPFFQTCIQKFFTLCNTYGSGITALATIALAIITFFYLMETRKYVIETKKQRELMHAQFVAANSPDMLIQTPRAFYNQNDNLMATEVKISNNGKSVEDIELLFALFCCEKNEDILKKYNEVIFLAWPTPIRRLGQNHTWTLTSGIEHQDKIRFEIATNDTSDIRIFAYTQLTYTKPALLIGGKPESVKDISSFWWNPVFKQWHGLSKIRQEQLKLFVERKIEEERKAAERPPTSK